MVSLSVAVTTLVLIAARAIIIVVMRPMRKRVGHSEQRGSLSGYIFGWGGILTGGVCLLLVNLISVAMEGVDIEFGHVPLVFGVFLLLLLGVLLISVGLAFAGLGPAPVDKLKNLSSDA